LSTKKTSDIEKALLQKGFKRDNTHHHMYWLHAKGKKTGIRTRLSHGKEEYSDKLLAMMAKQLKIMKKQFDSFVECSLTGEQYIQLLIDEGKIKLS
jgi:predicted RNA binding protein YcfA (HicA-like mRNA interferase family)